MSSICLSTTAHYYNSQGFLICMRCQPGVYASTETCVSDCSKTGGDLVPDNLNRVCKCRANMVLISKVCYNITTCPFRMCLNVTLGACVSCSFTCATCECLGGGVFCTSCFPGYVYIPFPSASCILDSALAQCPSSRLEFSPLYSQCLPSPELGDQRCLAVIPNCKTCLAYSAEMCLVCKEGSFLYHGLCLSQCPENMFVYRGVCVLHSLTDTNCTNFTVASVYSFARIDSKIVSQSATYQFYTLYESGNVVGQIIKRSLNRTRGRHNGTTYFSEALLKCLSCRSGYAVADKSSICEPCVLPCVTCTRPEPNSCLTCIAEAYVLEGRTCRLLFSLCSQGQYRNQNEECVDQCYTFFLKNQTTRVNCSENCPKGFTPIRENDVTYLTCVDHKKDNTRNFTKVFASLFRDHNGRLTMFMVPEWVLDEEHHPNEDVSGSSSDQTSQNTNKTKLQLPTFKIISPDQSSSRLLS